MKLAVIICTIVQNFLVQNRSVTFILGRTDVLSCWPVQSCYVLARTDFVYAEQYPIVQNWHSFLPILSVHTSAC